jgi:hypothetical protein
MYTCISTYDQFRESMKKSTTESMKKSTAVGIFFIDSV